MFVRRLKRVFVQLYYEIYPWRIYFRWHQYFRKVKKDNFLKVSPGALKEWRQKWAVFKIPFSDQSYRLFSTYIGEDVDICPMELVDTIIEPTLNPCYNWRYYSDKNIFDKLFPSAWLPLTILRNMYGNYYNEAYERILIFNDSVLADFLKPYQQIIIKPTLTCSGKGVRLFRKCEDGWMDGVPGEKLSCSFLDEMYGSDFIIQECLSQHQFTASLNQTSVNTIRVMTYRSVVTDEIIIPNVIVRIGKCGACVDNAHAGGVFCGVSEHGVLGKYVCDYLGNRSVIFNDIDFSSAHLQIPDYEKILDFSRKIASCIVDQRLLALDITLDREGCPKLIELNVGGFSAWLFQFTNKSTFGVYTNEVIDYCRSHAEHSRNLLLY